MTPSTEIKTLQTNIQSVPEIRALVDSVAEDAEFEESMTGTKIGDPLSAGLSLVAVAALWQLVSIGIETLRRMSENATVERRVELIRQLQAMGYERQAPFIVDRLLKEMRERPADDPVLKALVRMHPGGGQ